MPGVSNWKRKLKSLRIKPMSIRIMIRLLAALFILIIPVTAKSSVSGDSDAIYKAYISNNMPGWKKTMDAMSKKNSNDSEFLLQLLDYHYGYIAYCLGVDLNDEASGYLKQAWKIVEKLESSDYKPASIQAYKSALYGFEIGLGPYLAPFYGPKSMSAAQKATEKDPGNPLGFIQLGNMQFYMPPAFGGSKQEAIAYFNKAMLMLENQGLTTGNWQYLSLLATLGQAYCKVGLKQEAIMTYEKALQFEPEFLYVKNILLPACKKSTN